MIEIDGSKKSGSGTILRQSIALAAITNQPLHIYNIRQNRPQPGLRYQHLEAVLTVAKLSNAKVQGANLGSRELWFKPQQIKGGNIEAEIETAGSIPMLMLATMPVCLFADSPVHLHVAKGGTDTAHAPPINYIGNILLPTLKRMGINASITIHKYGYYPKGMGEAALTVEPNHTMKPIDSVDFGKLKRIRGISVCTFLADRKVAERQAKAAQEYLLKKGYNANIDIVNDESNPFQKGSSIVLWAETDNGNIIGSDGIGQLHKTAEAVGIEAATKLVTEISSHPTADVYLADMLIPYMALTKNKSVILARTISEHIEANIWLMEKMLKARFSIQKVNNLYSIEKSS